MKRQATAIAALLLTAACGNSTAPLAPFQPEVNNVTDSFQLQATGVTSVQTTLQYTWRNTGSAATVDHSTTTSSGSARVVIRDSSGATVYDQALVPSLNEPTLSGPTGTWSITLVLSSYSGTLNFRVQKG